jgi:hypothetical protein
MRILVEIDGVLRGRAEEPIATGVILVGTLTVFNQMILMASTTRSTAERWLDVNKIVDFDDVVDTSIGLVDEDLSKRQIAFARASGGVDLFITSNPKLWAYAFDLGIPSVMFGVPSYLRPEFRPDAPKKVRSWNEIEEAIEKQNAQRTQDARVKRTEGINFGDDR